MGECRILTNGQRDGVSAYADNNVALTADFKNWRYCTDELFFSMIMMQVQSIYVTLLKKNSSSVQYRRRRQREAEEAVAYVLHTARSWAQLRASPADRPQSEQIWCSQVMGGRPRGLRQLGRVELRL